MYIAIGCTGQTGVCMYIAIGIKNTVRPKKNHTKTQEACLSKIVPKVTVVRQTYNF